MLLASINIFDVKFLSCHAEQMLDAHEGARLSKGFQGSLTIDSIGKIFTQVRVIKWLKPLNSAQYTF